VQNSGAQKPGTKSAAAFRTISEVAGELGVPQHVLRFWETRFSQIKPLKRGGGRRYYRPEDVALLCRIRDLLYTDGYTIRGVQRLFREVGVKAVLDGAAADTSAPPAPQPASDSPATPDHRGELQAVLDELVEIRRLFGPL